MNTDKPPEFYVAFPDTGIKPPLTLDFRNQEMADKLLEAAITHTRLRGAKIVEAYFIGTLRATASSALSAFSTEPGSSGLASRASGVTSCT